MNKLIPLFITIITIISSSSYAQNNLEEMTDLLRTGDIENITNQLDEKVEVSIMEIDSYTKNDAKSMLTEFFLDKTDSDYVAIHKGNSDNNSYYQIGELRTEKETFRTYFYTKEIDGDFLVQELRIERQ